MSDSTIDSSPSGDRNPMAPPSPVLRAGWHYHFLGIGGVGMSALASLLKGQGIRVSGSDAHDSAALADLAAMGIPVTVGHSDAALHDVDAVVYSSAIRDTHSIWTDVRRRGLPRLHRAEVLGALAASRPTLAVTGTHGKTTCTAALAHALAFADGDPMAVVGGHVPQWEGRNWRAGRGPWLVTEADESDGSFVHLAPQAVLLTNVEEDHLDYHGTWDKLTDAFRAFLRRIQPGGRLVYCADDPQAAMLAASFDGTRTSYGLTAEADVRLEVHQLTREGTQLTFHRDGVRYGLTTPLVGRHNGQNLAGVFALATSVGYAAEPILAGLADFHGVARRQQRVGSVSVPGGPLDIYDDYAHHPTEVKATLEAFLGTHAGPLTVVFQPHLYSRTARFEAEFADALRPATQVYVTEIYGAREAPVSGVSGRAIVERLTRGSTPHPAAHFLPDWRELPKRVLQGDVPAGVLLTLGAGDVTGLGPLLLREVP